MCREVFNIGADEVWASVEATNEYYVGVLGQATRIMFPNGDVDPWSGLGVLESPDGNATLMTWMAYGSSHHAWTHPEGEVVQEAVRDAKAAVHGQVVEWLEEQ